MNLHTIEDPAQVQRGVDAVCAAWRRGASIRTGNLRGFLGDVVWRPKDRVWMSNIPWSSGDIWCQFVACDEPTDRVANASVYFHFAKGAPSGTAALLASDGRHVYLCHTGNLHLGAAKFLAWRRGKTEDVLYSSGESRPVIVVARLGSPTFAADLAHFAHVCESYKRHDDKPPVRQRGVVRRKKLPTTATQPGRQFRPEFAGEMEAPSALRRRVRSSRKHGAIVNALREAVEAAGLGVCSNDRQRDLIVRSEDGRTALVEVKVIGDPYDVYTALGQLTLHSRGFPSPPQMIAALPLTVAKQWAPALAPLGIRVLAYKSGGARVKFDDLNATFS